MQRFLHRVAILLISITTAQIAVADKAMESTAIADAEEKMKTTFSNITSTYFGKSPVEGMYEILAGSRMIYYIPKEDVLIFGEIFSKDGRSLTAEKISELRSGKVNDLDLTDALVIGQGEKSIMEFTNPDCQYCLKMHKRFRGEKNLKRIVFFSLPEGRANPRKKAIHIFCSKDKTQAFDNVFSRRIPLSELESCEEGERLVDIHRTISTAFGVSGTPTVILGNAVVTGFREAQIAQYLDD